MQSRSMMSRHRLANACISRSCNWGLAATVSRPIPTPNCSAIARGTCAARISTGSARLQERHASDGRSSLLDSEEARRLLSKGSAARKPQKAREPPAADPQNTEAGSFVDLLEDTSTSSPYVDLAPNTPQLEIQPVRKVMRQSRKRKTQMTREAWAYASEEEKLAIKEGHRKGRPNLPNISEGSTRLDTTQWRNAPAQFRDVFYHREGLILRRHSSLPTKVIYAAGIRYACVCSKCIDPTSGQRSSSVAQINPHTHVVAVRPSDEGLHILLREGPNSLDGSHDAFLGWGDLLTAGSQNPPDVKMVNEKIGYDFWDAATLQHMLRYVSYDDFMNTDKQRGDKGLWDVVGDLIRLGIVIVKDVPQDEDSIVKVTTRIANIYETFYGRTFDVRAKPDAENVAYTSGYLGPHQDLLYLNSPPKLQLLHCLENSCEGGESIFTDAHRIARLLLPHALKRQRGNLLVDNYTRYAYDRYGHNYSHQRPLIETKDGQFDNVWWSPPFIARGFRPNYDITGWTQWAGVFEKLINEKSAVFEHKLKPGECVIFDNLRVMHGRNAFDAEAGGHRWLRGAYISSGDFKSRASYMPNSYVASLPQTPKFTTKGADMELKKSKWGAEVTRAVEDMLETYVEVPQASKWAKA